MLARLAGAAVIGSACAAKSASGPAAVDSLASDASIDDAATPAVEASQEAGEAEAGPPTAQLRVAHASPDLPPIDVCVAPHGTGSFVGPLFAGLSGDAGAVDSGAVGLAFAQVSAYLTLAPGPYDARIVAAGASDCGAAGSLADGSSLPPLASDTASTLLVAGDASPAGNDPGLTLAVLPDDAALAGGAASLRAINAVPSAPSLDFGLGSFETQWVALLAGVGFASASSRGAPGEDAVDASGYLPIAPLSAQVLSARASSAATSDTAVASHVTIPMGSIATVIAVGGKTGDSTQPAALLFCIDNQAAGGMLADCSIASTP